MNENDEARRVAKDWFAALCPVPVKSVPLKYLPKFKPGWRPASWPTRKRACPAIDWPAILISITGPQWYMQQRIRVEMAVKQGKILLQAIIEADETYVG